ncbi:leucine-rich repeat domain-containing protein [Paenibacillus sp. J2TS4]|uniref:leucine-rich repeat domain-containing protein n=1 Tax=Paenibacillus sp. J2TS4 TaxID=2807194 RepID=UPI001B10482F|nr:leucine-rich repeat domain-containing protein [Paenibacillus sp. J2TS4]GIP34479.1 hypothetical protein J2TS4_36890 [Paenibacillus sp. J2TS4]
MERLRKSLAFVLSLSLLLCYSGVSYAISSNPENLIVDSTTTAPEEIVSEQSVTANVYQTIYQTIHFPDRNLELAVRDKLNKQDGDILVDEALSIEELEIYNGYISNLEGIQYLENLSVLKLNYNHIEDITLLSSLKSLTRLELKDNNIHDLTPLASLSSLISLYLQDNYIKDITPLSKLTQLQELYLSGNQVTDYSPTQPYYNRLIGKDFVLPQHKEDHAISFPDPYFEQAVRQAINKPEGDILVSYVHGLTDFGVHGEELKSIEGIQYFADLKNLSMSWTKVKDISPIRELTKLESLSFTDGELEDISSLENLKNLRSLSFQNNMIEDISSLSGLPYLNSLNLSYNHIEDISPLSNLTNLRSLYLRGNSVKDYTPTAAYYEQLYGKDFSLKVLSEDENIAISFPDPYFEQTVREVINKPEGDILVSDVHGLTDLYIFEREITNITGIQYFSDLRNLTTHSTKIEDISPIQGLTKLEYLSFTDGQLVDISVLRNLKNLRSLSFQNNKIEDITPLSGLPYLNFLNLSYNHIEDISPLSNLTNLRSLYLRGNSVKDYTPTAAYYEQLYGKDFSLKVLSEDENIAISFPDPYFEQTVREVINKPEGDILVSDVHGLTDLYIFEREITNITGIQYFSDLRNLTTHSTKIEDISPIQGLTKLEYLSFTDGQLVDISVLRNLKNLRSLSFQNNKIEDITPLSALPYLNSLNLSHNHIEDISPLSNLTNLRSLYLRGNPVKDYTPTAAYYEQLYGKDFSLILPEIIPITEVVLQPEELVLTTGDPPVALQATIYPANATFQTLIWSSSDENVVQVSREGLVQATGAGTAIITVHSSDKTEWATAQVIVLERKIAVEHPKQSIQVGQDDFTLAVSQQAEDVKLQFPVQQINAELKVATSPLIKVEMQTSLGQVNLLIPKGTLIKGSADWDGSLPLPTIRPNHSLTVSEAPSIHAIIEVGFDDLDLYFDQPVRLVIPGQGGRKAGYLKRGEFKPIERVLSADHLDAAIQEIPEDEEAKIDVGKDLIIWTKHFTTFIAYEDKRKDPPSGSNSGSGSGPGWAGGFASVMSPGASVSKKITKADGGVLELGELTIKVLPKSISEDFTLTLEKVTETELPKNSANLEFLDEAYKLSPSKEITWQKPFYVTLSIPDELSLDSVQKSALYYWAESTEEWLVIDNLTINEAERSLTGEWEKLGLIALFINHEQESGEPTDAGKDQQTAVLMDIKDHWAEKDIIQLVHQGIIKGYPDQTFRPDHKITRAEFVSILVPALGLELTDGKIFTDTANHWAQKEIAAAYSQGIVGGYSEAEFGPDDAITREQIASMIVRAFNLQPKELTNPYKDHSDISIWAIKAIEASIAHGIMDGYPDNTIQPQGQATRAEAATMVIRALNLQD